uniref:Uncharacterized protein n=1 Tax=Anguilla anguilla TaxID=7936 RepID=A0A0E9WS02_ANGAN
MRFPYLLIRSYGFKCQSSLLYTLQMIFEVYTVTVFIFCCIVLFPAVPVPNCAKDNIVWGRARFKKNPAIFIMDLKSPSLFDHCVTLIERGSELSSLISYEILQWWAI